METKLNLSLVVIEIFLTFPTFGSAWKWPPYDVILINFNSNLPLFSCPPSHFIFSFPYSCPFVEKAAVFPGYAFEILNKQDLHERKNCLIAWIMKMNKNWSQILLFVLLVSSRFFTSYFMIKINLFTIFSRKLSNSLAHIAISFFRLHHLAVLPSCCAGIAQAIVWDE